MNINKLLLQPVQIPTFLAVSFQSFCKVKNAEQLRSGKSVLSLNSVFFRTCDVAVSKNAYVVFLSGHDSECSQ